MFALYILHLLTFHLHLLLMFLMCGSFRHQAGPCYQTVSIHSEAALHCSKVMPRLCDVPMDKHLPLQRGGGASAVGRSERASKVR